VIPQRRRGGRERSARPAGKNNAKGPSRKVCKDQGQYCFFLVFGRDLRSFSLFYRRHLNIHVIHYLMLSL
jgi:hypothetical protein